MVASFITEECVVDSWYNCKMMRHLILFLQSCLHVFVMIYVSLSHGRGKIDVLWDTSELFLYASFVIPDSESGDSAICGSLACMI